MKGLSQGTPYFGQVFTVETPNVGNGQARVKAQNSDTVMIMSAAYLEPADAAAPVDAAAMHGQAVGHTPQWLAQDASTNGAQTQRATADGAENDLQAGDLVRLKGQSQYSGQVFTVESADVGDGRVRVSLQLSETSVSRMAFDPSFLERVEVEEQGQQPQAVAAVESQHQVVQQVVEYTMPPQAMPGIAQPQPIVQAAVQEKVEAVIMQQPPMPMEAYGGYAVQAPMEAYAVQAPTIVEAYGGYAAQAPAIVEAPGAAGVYMMQPAA